MNIVVFGASGGIGAALVRQLESGGHRVFSISLHNPLSRVHCDITDPSAVRSTFEKIIKEGFAPECVIIASGVFKDDLIPHYDRALLDKNFAVNFFGVLNVIDAILPYFISVGKGHVVALSSIAALRPNKRGVGYPASKAALSLAMRGFDLAFRSKGVAFSVAHVGPVNTALWDGGASFLVASPERVARDIATLVGSRKAALYTPFLSTTLARLASYIPDRLYMALRKTLL
ncbi:MAG TPA: SDR family NAD(P)-dependent oxidoreductase [Candidatus Paceibacterota bacterium]